MCVCVCMLLYILINVRRTYTTHLNLAKMCPSCTHRFRYWIEQFWLNYPSAVYRHIVYILEVCSKRWCCAFYCCCWCCCCCCDSTLESAPVNLWVHDTQFITTPKETVLYVRMKKSSESVGCKHLTKYARRCTCFPNYDSYIDMNSSTSIISKIGDVNNFHCNIKPSSASHWERERDR